MLSSAPFDPRSFYFHPAGILFADFTLITHNFYKILYFIRPIMYNYLRMR